MRHIYTLLFATMLSLLTAYSQPTDNPYKTRYGTDGKHWTDSLRWNSVYNVVSYGAVANDTSDDLTAVNLAIAAAYSAGGGVVYFPAGTYVINDDLHLKSGVIIRGFNPLVSDAKDASYVPSSKLVFPQYIPSYTGTGTPKSAAFKAITRSDADSAINNIAIVNLDINRAIIDFHPNFKIVGILYDPGANPNFQPTTTNRNCMVFGIRSNNAAIPDPAVPTATQGQWQRFPWRFAANIDLYFFANVIVANNRLNDNITDNFYQPGYICKEGAVWTAMPSPIDTLAKFRYTDHYGISVNRAKIIKDAAGKPGIKSIWWYAFPWQEPYLYAQGNEIIDNWVKTTMRIKITAAGLGLKILNNVTRDNYGKIDYLTPNGQNHNTNYSATFENRGIDFSGWNTLVEGNDVQAFIHGFYGQPYASICGEGIMNQGNSGGTIINGAIIRNNLINSISSQETNPCISLYKVREISNALVYGNTAVGPNKYIYLSANNSATWHISNITVKNNLDFNKINIECKAGRFGLLDSNDGIGGDLTYPCFVTLGDNPGHTDNGCYNASSIMAGKVLYPTKDTLVNSGDVVDFSFRISGGAADSIKVYDVNKKWLGLATLIDSTASISLSFSEVGKHYITAEIKEAGVSQSWIPITVVSVCNSCVTATKKLSAINPMKVFPIPASNEINVVLPSNTNVSNATIINLVGASVFNTKISGTTTTFDISSLSSGIYFFVASINGKTERVKFVKK